MNHKSLNINIPSSYQGFCFTVYDKAQAFLVVIKLTSILDSRTPAPDSNFLLVQTLGDTVMARAAGFLPPTRGKPDCPAQTQLLWAFTKWTNTWDLSGFIPFTLSNKLILNYQKVTWTSLVLQTPDSQNYIALWCRFNNYSVKII